jgi:hypothetical protein
MAGDIELRRAPRSLGTHAALGTGVMLFSWAGLPTSAPVGPKLGTGDVRQRTLRPLGLPAQPSYLRPRLVGYVAFACGLEVLDIERHGRTPVERAARHRMPQHGVPVSHQRAFGSATVSSVTTSACLHARAFALSPGAAPAAPSLAAPGSTVPGHGPRSRSAQRPVRTPYRRLAEYDDATFPAPAPPFGTATR